MESHNFQILLSKTSTCYGDADLNIDYCDETSDEKLSLSKGQGRALDSIHYITKEETGRVMAGGFLRKKLLAMTREGEAGPESLNNNERKNRITRAWLAHLDFHGRPRKRGVQRKGTQGSNEIIGHKVVVSLSPEFETKCLKKGINPDAVLQITAKKAMTAYEKEFLKPGDSLGYCYGIHHDQDNTHLHLFVCPTSKNGEVVGMSNPLKGKESHQADHLGLLKSNVATEQEFWKRALDDPKLLMSLKKRHNSEFLFIAKATKKEIEYREALFSSHRQSSAEMKQILSRDYVATTDWERAPATGKQIAFLRRLGVDPAAVKNKGHAAFILKSQNLKSVPTKSAPAPYVPSEKLKKLRRELLAKREKVQSVQRDFSRIRIFSVFESLLGIRPPWWLKITKDLLFSKKRELKSARSDYFNTRRHYNDNLHLLLSGLAQGNGQGVVAQLSPQWREFYRNKSAIQQVINPRVNSSAPRI